MDRRNIFNDGLFPTSQTSSYIKADPANNMIINESIISDMLGSKELLNEFYSNLGRFGYRDGVLSETASTDIKLAAFDKCDSAECSSILATAKENNDEDYEVYSKCIMLMQKCLENMKSKYGNIAKDRLETQKTVIENNPRIQDAIDKTIENHPEI